MRDTPERHRNAADRTVKDIRRKTRKRYSSEDKIRIVLAGLRGEEAIAELCRQEGIAQSQYYSWSKDLFRRLVPSAVSSRRGLALSMRSCSNCLKLLQDFHWLSYHSRMIVI